MTARTVIHSNGRAYRTLLSQPPSYRRGSEPVVAIDPAVRAAVKALRYSNDERAALYHTNGSGRRTN